MVKILKWEQVRFSQNSQKNCKYSINLNIISTKPHYYARQIEIYKFISGKGQPDMTNFKMPPIFGQMVEIEGGPRFGQCKIKSYPLPQ